MFYAPECHLSWWMFHVSLRRLHILLLLDEVVYRCPLYPVDWWYCWAQLHPCWFSACWICPFLIEGVEVFNYDSGFLSFSLQSYQVLPHVVWHTLLSTYTLRIVVFLEYWSLFHYFFLNFIYLFIYGCVGSSFLCEGFL